MPPTRNCLPGYLTSWKCSLPENCNQKSTNHYYKKNSVLVRLEVTQNYFQKISL